MVTIFTMEEEWHRVWKAGQTSKLTELIKQSHSPRPSIYSAEYLARPPKRGKIELELPSERIENTRYSCPFRKHSRQRYNIHTHRTCALSCFRQSLVSSKDANLSNITYAKFTGNIFIELTVLQFNVRAVRFNFGTKTL